MEHKYLCLRAEGAAEWVTLRDFSSGFADDVHTILKNEGYRVVKTFVEDVVMIIDPCALSKPHWWNRINYAASDLSPDSLFGAAVVGDAILAYKVGDDIVPVPRYIIRSIVSAFSLYLEADYDDSTQ